MKILRENEHKPWKIKELRIDVRPRTHNLNWIAFCKAAKCTILTQGKKQNIAYEIRRTSKRKCRRTCTHIKYAHNYVGIYFEIHNNSIR